MSRRLTASLIERLLIFMLALWLLLMLARLSRGDEPDGGAPLVVEISPAQGGTLGQSGAIRLGPPSMFDAPLCTIAALTFRVSGKDTEQCVVMLETAARLARAERTVNKGIHKKRTR